jgi:hypothetical protein
MDIDFFYKIVSISVSINIIILAVMKTFWNLTVKKIEEDVIILKEAERKNSILRHDFRNVTSSVYEKMDKLEGTLIKSIADGYTNVKDLFNVQIENINKRIDEKK